MNVEAGKHKKKKTIQLRFKIGKPAHQGEAYPLPSTPTSFDDPKSQQPHFDMEEQCGLTSNHEEEQIN